MATTELISTSDDANLPRRVLLLATGGTVAGIGDTPLMTSTYQDARLDADALLRSVPNVESVAKVTAITFSNIGSEYVTSKWLMSLLRTIREWIASGSVDGIVVTSGSDTMEETAMFLDLVLDGDLPVVMVAAMRPSTALSADGPLNLVQAISLASSRASWGRGALMTWCNHIGSARYTTKATSPSTDAWSAHERGLLGTLVDSKPIFYMPPSRHRAHLAQSLADLDQAVSLPKVVILYGHQEMDIELLNFAWKSPSIRGVVIACTGNGTLPREWEDMEKEMTADGCPVVRSSRLWCTYVTPRSDVLTSGHYSPQKARIVLQLGLVAFGASTCKLQSLLDENAA